MSHSRVLGSGMGADHPDFADWISFVTDPANYNSGDWDDAVSGNGGDQIVRLQDESFTDNTSIDVDALATATHYKVTVRPDFEGGATSVGAKALADGQYVNAYYTPAKRRTSNDHQGALQLVNSTDVEWHVEDIMIDASNHDRTKGIHLTTSLVRDMYIDRCMIHKTHGSSNNHGPIGRGPSSTSYRVYIRSCIVSWKEGPGATDNGQGFTFLGCSFFWDGSQGWFLHTSGSNPGEIYGCAIGWNDADGVTTRSGTNLSSGNFSSDYNVTNLTGTSWTDDFNGANDVDNATRAAMFVGADASNILDLFPKSGGALDGAITWSGLPAGIQALWPDDDILGQAIAKSGTLTAGAIQLAAPEGSAVAPIALHYIRMRSAA